ncbi:MAG TPA: DUF4062 domain-containing protein [Candidatus Onthoplasma faecigallinarum]|nr:DUF4062 domain-containing protein [Candidatus Onthoplasma faecigallinarum]
MEKKYQVFISSTYKDLIEERKKAQEILLMADCIPAGMEVFVAANDEQFEVIKKVIDLCDYYVLIIGGKYGSINKTTGLSYTEMEYDYAVSQGVPVLVFAIDESVKLSDDKRDKDIEILFKLKKFREKAMTNRLASIWKDLGDLSGKLAISIMKAKEENIRSGWIRGIDYDLTENLKKITTLQDENKKLVEEISSLKKSLEEYSSFDGELEFDDNKINIEFTSTNYRGGRYVTLHHNKEITLKEIFGYVSINMINVSVAENAVRDYIAKSIGADNFNCLVDKNVSKRICNQFIALKLMDTKWIEGKGLYYYLTSKGIKLRDEINLFKKKID